MIKAADHRTIKRPFFNAVALSAYALMLCACGGEPQPEPNTGEPKTPLAELNIEDPKLRGCVNAVISDPSQESAINYIEEITELRCSDFTGLHELSQFTGLTHLAIFNSDITNLRLDSLTNLESVNLSFVRGVAQFNTQSNHKLRDFIFNNFYATIPTDSPPENSAGLDFSTNTKLQSININGWIGKRNIHLPSSPQLTSLQLSNSALSIIDVEPLHNLQTLDLHGNQLKFIDLTGNSRLSSLNLADNPIECDLADSLRDTFAPLETFHIDSDIRLNCGVVRDIQDETFKNCLEEQAQPLKQIETLECEGVADFSGFEHLTALRSFKYFAQQATQETLNDLIQATQDLEDLSLRFYNPQASDFSQVPDQARLDLHYQGLTNTLLDLSSVKHAEKVRVNLSELSGLQFRSHSTIEALELANVTTDLLQLAEGQHIDNFLIRDGAYKKVDVSQATLTGSFKLLSKPDSLNLGNQKELRSLRIEAGGATELTMGELANLASFKLLGCHGLKELDLANAIELESIEVQSHSLEVVSLPPTDALNNIDITQSQLHDLDLSNNHQVRSLKLNYNKLETIDLTNLHDVTHVSIVANLLRSITLPAPSSIETLLLSHNRLSHISLQEQSKLERALLNGNYLEHIEFNSQNSSVNLADNLLSDINILPTEISPDSVSNNEILCSTLIGVYGNIDNTACRHARTDKIHDLHIPDPALAECITRTNAITIGQLTHLDCSKETLREDQEIHFIQGINYLTALKTLNLSGNDIFNDPSLNKLDHLEELVLSNANFPRFSAARLADIAILKTLDLSNNRFFTYLDTKGLDLLEELNVSRTGINWLDTEANPLLNQLDTDYTPLVGHDPSSGFF